ncbi:MAG: hypothetical protein M3Z36_15270 [Acidobacteriota bacterium]|nr:hypothetical protein [Acidobacteriota bacterium]
MQIENRYQGEMLSSQTLKGLASATGPCASIFLPLGEASNFVAELKRAVHSVEEQLQNKTGPNGARALLEPLRKAAENVASDERIDEHRGQTLVLLCSTDSMHVLWAAHSIPARASVADHFEVRPLLTTSPLDQPFYILALSQRQVRLLRCTKDKSEEVALPEYTATSLADSKDTSKPDHDLDNMASGGPSTGSMRGVISTTNTDREHKDNYILQFFQGIDRGLNVVLKNETAPLVLVGVEYELALYKLANKYAHMIETGVHGAPDGLKGPEMHSRAIEILEKHFAGAAEKALAQFERLVNSNNASVTVKDIVKAAYESRVAHLFLREDAEYKGTFDEAGHSVKSGRSEGPESEDLLNATALQTLQFGGDVFVLPANKMPNGVPAAAVFRY